MLIISCSYSYIIEDFNNVGLTKTTDKLTLAGTIVANFIAAPPSILLYKKKGKQLIDLYHGISRKSQVLAPDNVKRKLNLNCNKLMLVSIICG